jgi:Family of unknown function (DUF5856)
VPLVGMTSKQIQFLFEIRNQIKLYHWQTYQHSRHIATDKYLESLDKHIDYFVEVSMGKYGRPKVTGATATITLKNMTEKTAAIYLNAARAYLQGTFSKTINPKDTDLLNIRDEILGDINQLAYLFTLA